MAYRFVLEAPESVAFEVNTVINSVPDAQVLVMRNSHGLGFNDPYFDYSVAAHSFAVVERVFRWMTEYGEPYPDIRLVMHDGRRVSFAKANVSLIIAAIRRDQPWIDHTIPQIGVHEPKPWLAKDDDAYASEFVAIDVANPETLVRRFESAPTIPIHNLAPAEQYYEEVMNLHVTARATRNDRGEFLVIEGDYDPKLARLQYREADVVFMENGPLQLNLQRFPRGTALPYGTNPVHIHTSATPEQLRRIKGRTMVYGSDLLESNDDFLRFVDPYNVAWTITSTAHVDDSTPAALQG